MRSEFHFLLLAIYARVCEFHLELLPSTWEKDKEECVFFRKRYTRIIVITTLNHLFDGWFIAYCNIVEASQLLFQRDKKKQHIFLRRRPCCKDVKPNTHKKRRRNSFLFFSLSFKSFRFFFLCCFFFQTPGRPAAARHHAPHIRDKREKNILELLNRTSLS